MFLFKSPDHEATVPMHYESHSSVVLPPESVGTIMGKLSLVWGGLFAGISLGDIVLVATLVYTVLQTGLAVYERIIKPIHEMKRIARILRAAEAAKLASLNQSSIPSILNTPSTSSTSSTSKSEEN